MCVCCTINPTGCWRRETWRPQKSRSRGLNSCRGTDVGCRRRAVSRINPSSLGNKLSEYPHFKITLT